MDQKQLADFLAQARLIAEHTKPDPNVFSITVVLAFVTILTLVATLGMASATVRMANETSKIERDTADAALLADIHHQEALSGVVCWLGDRQIIQIKDRLVMCGYLANVGPGAAVGISIEVRGFNEGRFDGEMLIGSTSVPTLPSGAEYFVQVPMSNPSQRRIVLDCHVPVNLERRLGDLPAVIIRYETIFERRRASIYPCNGGATASPNVALQFNQEWLGLNRERTELTTRRDAPGYPRISTTTFPENFRF
jgi:hypothetical protein